jgi:hypothetical protein
MEPIFKICVSLCQSVAKLSRVNKLLFGDNLKWLRDPKLFPDASVDLVYLDPPFNSNADYNVLFREASGEASQAQFTPSPTPGTGRTPRRLTPSLWTTVAATAKLLGFTESDIQILMAMGKLTPLGDPAPNAPKWFAAVEVILLAADQDWLHKATKEITKFWKTKRQRRQLPSHMPLKELHQAL